MGSTPAEIKSDEMETGKTRENRPALLMRLAGAPIIPMSTLSSVGFPVGVTWANWFAFFNAISWSVVLGAPLYLFAKHIGAGDELLGIIAALPPLLVVLHIPGNYLIPRLGYRRMVIFGWGARTAAVVFIALIPVAVTQHGFALALLVLLLIVFSLCRGLAGGAWMPWLSTLVPTDIRGKFFLRDQLFGQTGNVLTLILTAAIFTFLHGRIAFSVAFALAALGGMVSVICLLPVPDVTDADLHTEAGSRIALFKMLSADEFRRLCIFNVAYMLVMGSLTVFTVAYLHDIAGLPSAEIIGLTAFSTLGGVASLFWCGKVLDRIGSRPILAASLLALILVFFCWFLIAAGAISPQLPILGAVYLLSGMAGINFSAANNRLQSLKVPKLGRNHHFAVLLVLLNIAAGVSPMFWGLVLETIGRYHHRAVGLNWNRYTFLFGTCALMLIPVLIMLRSLDDHRPEIRSVAGATAEAAES
ncbi:MAG: MFS transporter [Phycisphaerae bacterium]